MTTDVLDIDVEMYNPVNAERRYREAGYSDAQVEAMLQVAAMIYARPHKEIRETVAKRRALGQFI